MYHPLCTRAEKGQRRSHKPMQPMQQMPRFQYQGLHKSFYSPNRGARPGQSQGWDRPQPSNKTQTAHVLLRIPDVHFQDPDRRNRILTALHHIMAGARIFVDYLPVVFRITMRSENTNGDNFAVECTGDSISPRNRTARVALYALFKSKVFAVPYRYM